MRDLGARLCTDGERLVAAALDALHISWVYEPHLFVLRWNDDGTVAAGMRPDFYLPRHDLYIEVTGAKEPTRKNAKVRALQAEHPNVEVVVFYRRDLRGDLKQRIREVVEPRRRSRST